MNFSNGFFSRQAYGKGGLSSTEEPTGNTQEEIEKLRAIYPLISGAPGTGKTSLARVTAIHCGYKPMIVDLVC